MQRRWPRCWAAAIAPEWERRRRRMGSCSSPCTTVVARSADAASPRGCRLVGEDAGADERAPELVVDIAERAGAAGVGCGFGPAAEAIEEGGELAVHAAVLGPERQAVLECGDRLVVLAGAQQGRAELPPMVGVVGLELGEMSVG